MTAPVTTPAATTALAAPRVLRTGRAAPSAELVAQAARDVASAEERVIRAEVRAALMVLLGDARSDRHVRTANAALEQARERYWRLKDSVASSP